MGLMMSGQKPLGSTTTIDVRLVSWEPPDMKAVLIQMGHHKGTPASQVWAVSLSGNGRRQRVNVIERVVNGDFFLKLREKVYQQFQKLHFLSMLVQAFRKLYTPPNLFWSPVERERDLAMGQPVVSGLPIMVVTTFVAPDRNTFFAVLIRSGLCLAVCQLGPKSHESKEAENQTRYTLSSKDSP
ncbi:NAD(P)-linked oxidoreductase superfamily protein [Striga asiatica]|uniref:NAD(P)-linked oxidoreductase superfamily protein n=1 Tax=Striga asiatica TaxID=4170 RepID=A0A5A7Q2F8_STRAF|nr:NAD(P)-linked oxidoreductase superfamily protein [Striga asiatica]